MTTKLRVFEAFAGYGSQSLALKKYNVPFESVGISEIDEPAILANCAVHHEGTIKYPPTDIMLKSLIEWNIALNFKEGTIPWTKLLITYDTKGKLSDKALRRVQNIYRSCILTNNFGDISLVDEHILPDMDLFTFSFPCTNISAAGRQEGLSQGSGTKSSLLWECQRIIETKHPKYLMMENVKALVSKKFKHDFDRWLNILDDLGYNNYWKVINAKYCGVPQNRERVFCVSILKSEDNGTFHFYDDFDSGIRLRDVLEDDVDETYYLKESMVQGFIPKSHQVGYINQDTQASKVISVTEHFQTLCAGTHGYANGYVKVDLDNNSILKVGAINSSQDGVVVSPDGISPTHSAGHGNCPKIIEACAIRGRNPDNPKSRESGLPTVQMVEISKNPEVSNCLTTVQKDSLVLERAAIKSSKTRYGKKHALSKLSKHSSFRIRRLTNRECFRLMDVGDISIDKLQAVGISSTQQYRMAGNSIVVACMKFLEQLHD